ncbi:MAG: hypothetical protein WCJ35_26185 [Planctomycetota bacterium]
MARDLQVSQPVAWRVMQGKQTPPGKLIENLARDPRVSLAWLFRGEGNLTGAGGQVMPVAKAIFPGQPDNHQDLLSGEFYSVSSSFCRPSRYWLEIQASDPVLRSRRSLNVRDLLLLETDRNVFPTADRLVYLLCGVRIEVEGQSRLKLGLVNYIPADKDSGPAHIEVDTFDLGVNPSDIKCDVAYREFRGSIRRFESFYRWETSLKTGKKIKVPVCDYELDPVLPVIDYKDVVCVSVLMVRRDPNAI